MRIKTNWLIFGFGLTVCIVCLIASMYTWSLWLGACAFALSIALTKYWENAARR